MIRRTTKYAVEYLIFQVKDEHRITDFIELDQVIWTDFLKEQAGFISKEIWQSDLVKGQLHSIVYWESLSHWQAIPVAALIENDQKFQDQFGAADFELIQKVHQENPLTKISEFFVNN